MTGSSCSNVTVFATVPLENVGNADAWSLEENNETINVAAAAAAQSYCCQRYFSLSGRSDIIDESCKNILT